MIHWIDRLAIWLFGKWMRCLHRADPARKIAVHRQLAEELNGLFCYIQLKMNIHPDSPRHKPDFTGEFGGFHTTQGKRSIVPFYSWDSVRRDFLVMLMREVEERAIPGVFAEVGVYRGETARLFHHYTPERVLFLFDTFEGFDPVEARRDRRAGQEVPDKLFADTSEREVIRYIGSHNERVRSFPGLFPQTADIREVKEADYAFVHLDADLYDPIKAGLEFFWPRLSPGGVIVVHDYNAWKGARQAVEEFMVANNLFGIPMPDQSGSYVLRKGNGP